MSMNKKLLAAAISGLLVSANAGAVVLGTDPARTYAVELVNNTVLSDANDDIQVALGYNFSDGEVRYGRLECTTNMTIGSPVVADDSADITLGAINGAGTPALFFSITALDSVTTDPMQATAGVVLSLDSTNTLLDKSNVNCAFSIYDQPSQAQAGGPTGRIYTTGFKPFVDRKKSFAFTSAGGRSTADVQADPAYTAFVANDRDFGSLTFGLSTAAAAGTVLDQDGSAITLADIFAATTTVEVSGAYDAATTVAWAGTNANPLTDTKATWTGAALDLAVDGVTGNLTFNEDGTSEIAVSDYSAMLTVETNTGYEASDESLTDVGEIDRNGTELQAPLVQLPGGYMSRVVLTNTGGVDRPYRISFQYEDGNGATEKNLTGKILGNKTSVVDLTNVLSDFTQAGNRRATLKVIVDAPNNQIQGLYQIVNPTYGSVSNHVMVRPGTN
jgi:hypothetical protein